MANNYTIKPGDTITQIAHKNNTTIEELLKANPDLEDRNSIKAGQKLNLPESVAASNSTNVNAAQLAADVANQATEAERGTYTVKPGDTAFQIAKQYKVSVADIQSVNPEIADLGKIGIGQKIRVPVPSQATAKQNAVTSAPSTPVQAQQVKKTVPDSTELMQDVAPDKTEKKVVSTTQASKQTKAYNIPPEDIDNAWKKVAGLDVTGRFQDAAYDKRPLIVIDPGHSAKSRSGALDKGSTSADKKLTEVDVVDPVATALALKLSQAGHRVAFTRNPGEEFRYGEGDRPNRLDGRALFAKALEDQINAPYTIFISLHANQASAAARGFEIQIDNAQHGRDGPATSAHSKKLAECVLGCIDGYEGLKNRGVKTANTRILDMMEKDSTPSLQPDASILIETGFLSNDEDAKILDSMRQNPQNIADRIAKGVQEYLQTRDPGVATAPSTKIGL